MPDIEHVVVMDAGEFANADSFAAITQRAPELEQQDAAFDAMVKEAKPEDLATIIYTSGTTGDPKGVMLTHGNLASNLRYSTDGFGIVNGDVSISFLPLSHVTARHLDYALYYAGCGAGVLPEVRPAGEGDEGGSADGVSGGAAGV